MDILVAYGSKYGSTQTIADRIAEVLRSAGHTVTVQAASKSCQLDRYQGVVLGSCVYAGRLHSGVLALVAAQSATLAAKRLAIFAVSMTAADQDPAKQAEAQAFLKPLTAALQPDQSACFGGRIDPDSMPWLARVIARAMGAKPTDARDWPAVENWASQLALAWQ